MSVKSRIVLLILIVISILVPLACDGAIYYQSHQKREPRIINANLENICNIYQTTALALYAQANPDYKPVSLKDESNAAVYDSINQDFRAYLSNYLAHLEVMDPALKYRAEYKDISTEKNWKDQKNSDLKDMLFWYRISFNANGSYSITSNDSSTSWYNNNIQKIDQSLNGYQYYLDEDMNEYAGSMDQIGKINMPQDFTVVFAVPKDLPYRYTPNSISAQFYEYYDPSAAILGTAFCLGAALLLIVALFPYEDEKEIPVFKLITGWKALFTAVILGTALMASLSLGMIGSSSILDGTTNYFSTKEVYQGNTAFAYIYTSAAVFIFCWSVYSISFYGKYILKKGLKNFFIEDTAIYGICSYVENKFHQISQMDFSKKHNRMIFGLVTINAFVFVLICAVSVLLESVLAFIILLGIYSAVLLLILLNEFGKIQLNYEDTYDMAKLLAQGKFNRMHRLDVGIMQSLYDELLKIKPGFESAVQEATSSQNMKTQLITNVSHDLKTPITGIKSYVELINQANTMEEVKEYTAKLDGYCVRLNRLVEDLFDVAKADSGNLPLERMELNVCDLVMQVHMEHEREWEKKGLKTMTNFPPYPITLNLDPNRTMRMVDNLETNVLKYAMENTRVFIEVHDLPDEIKIIYKNISKFPLEFDTEQILERFARGDASRHEAGSGLGLAIIQSFGQIQNGDFQVQTDGDLFKAIITFKK